MAYSFEVTLNVEKTSCFCCLSVVQSVYETWFIPFYTVFYTAYPVLLLALFEQVRLLKLRSSGSDITSLSQFITVSFQSPCFVP